MSERAAVAESSESAPPALVEGAVFEGLLVLPGPGRIDGRVRGEVMAGGDVWVGPTGVVEAHLSGRVVVIEGRVEGDVRARARIDLRPGGRVRGGLSAPRLVIADGSLVDGPCEAGTGSGSGLAGRSETPGSP
jgi:cytoskeletal protein CcmA (bactofilin family)